MIPIVRRYCVGRPASQRLLIQKTWESLWKKNANESDTRGLGPSFAKTALAFMQAMKEQGIRARRGSDPIQPQQAGGIYAAE
jgi:hypothetical protein